VTATGYITISEIVMAVFLK